MSVVNDDRQYDERYRQWLTRPGGIVHTAPRSTAHFLTLARLLADVLPDDHDQAVQLALTAKRLKQRFFFIGNGGSAAIASHMSADWLKTASVAAMCFNQSPLMSCIANDLGYDRVFAQPLTLHGSAGDVLFAISSSGKSKSITSAAQIARDLRMKVITLSGFQPDNLLRSLGHVNFHVPSEKYGLVEVAHHAICHSILDAVIDADSAGTCPQCQDSLVKCRCAG